MTPTRVPALSLLELVLTSVNIMQVRITRSRMAGDPPEVVIAPQLAHLGLMDFYRAEEAIAEEPRAAEKTLPFFAAVGVGVVSSAIYRSGCKISPTGSEFTLSVTVSTVK